MSDRAFSLRLLPEEEPTGARVESYRRLADVFHDVLAEQSLDALLDRIADALAELVPHDSLTIYEADEPRRLLVPVWARDKWADKILADTCPFGVGLTGWGVEHREPVRTNQAHLDPRTATVAGTPPDEPEAMITIPLVARGLDQGRAQHLQPRRRGAASTTTSSSWRSASATPPRWRSTTRRSVRASSTRHRQTL